MDNLLLHSFETSSLATCLRAMRFSLLQFSKIHNPDVLGEQLPNAHEAYLPVSLRWGHQNEVSVNDLFVNDFSAVYGTYDVVDGIHKPKVFIVYGDRGFGKTALVNYLMYEWLLDEANDVKKIKDFDLAIVIEVEKINDVLALPMLESKLPLCYMPSCMKFDDVTEELKKKKILWLFDGFEKVTINTKKAIGDAIEHFPASQVVITSHERQSINIRYMMELLQVKYVPLNLMDLTSHTWKLMAPKMIATKTYDPGLAQELSSRFISDHRRKFEEGGVPRPKDLGYAVYAWLIESYPWVSQGVVIPKGRGRSNEQCSQY
ncbi:uncharacterized protein LOC135223287 [Macrobrachium nipponense]|uniref:uncharacterized protein LOC135223287 n=1 Tax=Macrobrachium nipponense TaxID=159736 RepID=UPI0030C8577A